MVLNPIKHSCSFFKHYIKPRKERILPSASPPSLSLIFFSRNDLKINSPILLVDWDPVTDDVDWDMFSADLADGIVVSILDSFVLELPVLDFSMVQSVFEALDKN